MGLKEVVHYDAVAPYDPNRTENGTNASKAELGDDPFDNRVMLCSCCTPPPLVPSAVFVPTRDQWVALYWAAIVGLVGVPASIIGGVVAATKLIYPKTSKVHPDD